MSKTGKRLSTETWRAIFNDHINLGMSYNLLSKKYGLSKGSLSPKIRSMKDELGLAHNKSLPSRSKNVNIYSNPVGPFIRSKSNGYKYLKQLLNKRDARKAKAALRSRLYTSPIGPKKKLVGREYILSRININYETNCWEWTGTPTSAGYGQLTINGVYWTAHRYSYTQFNGEIPKGLLIRHMCHNPICCNPEHLKTGTYLDNYNDSLDKYLRAAKKSCRRVRICNVWYESISAASSATGLDGRTITKHLSYDDIFDLAAYRIACSRNNSRPKL